MVPGSRQRGKPAVAASCTAHSVRQLGQASQVSFALNILCWEKSAKHWEFEVDTW